MLSNILITSTLFVASALAVAAPAPTPYSIGAMSFNNAFGLAKRQAGYQPTQTLCGPGTDCASSCGAGYVQCDSTDGDLHCYEPGLQQTCCPDGTGNSCDEGYFCTSDSSGNTWCCPNGMSLAQCAAAYSLTGTLVSETQTSTGAAASSTAPSSVSVTTTSTSSSTTTATNTYTPKGNNTIYNTQSSNFTATKTATSTLVQFTAASGANPQVVLGGLPALLLAAGALLAF